MNKLKEIFTIENIKGMLKETVETVVFVIVMVVIIRFFIGEIRWIPSSSMEPTLQIGDRLFVERYSRFFTKPKRGDIVVFYPPMEKIETDSLSVFSRLTGFFCKDIAYIKRVIGVEGDEILIKKSKSSEFELYINGKKEVESYIYEKEMITECTNKMYCGPFRVPKGHLFMLGDNRNNSQDSRFWGFLPENRIIGTAKCIFWPINRIQRI